MSLAYIRSMRRAAIVASIVALAGADVAQAVDGWDVPSYNARNNALKQDYFSMHDDYDIWVNPAWLGHYANRVYGSLTLADLQSTADDSRTQLAGGQLEVGPVAVGAYMGRPYSGTLRDYWIAPNMIATPGNIIVPQNNSSAVKNLFDVFASMKLGVVDAGVRLNVNRYSDQRLNPVGKMSSGIEVNGDEQKLSASDVNAVFGVVSRQFPVDVAFGIGRPASDNNFDYDETGPSGRIVKQGGAKVRGSEYSMVARADVYSFDKGLIRVSASIDKSSFSVEQTNRVETGGTMTTDQSGQYNLKVLSLGGYGAFVLKPAENVTLIASGGLRYSHASGSEESYDQINVTPLQSASSYSSYVAEFPARLGVEVNASSHWTLRAGASRVVYKASRISAGATVINGVTQELSTPRRQVSDADPLVSLALGARFNLGDALMLDGTINKDIFQTGTYLLSGVSDRLLTQLSLIYKF